MAWNGCQVSRLIFKYYISKLGGVFVCADSADAVCVCEIIQTAKLAEMDEIFK